MKGKMVEAEELHPKNVVQTHIDLIMDEVNEHAEDKIQHFDEWLEFRTVTFAKKLWKKQVLEKFIALEKAALKDFKTVTVAHAMEHMV